MTSKPILIVRYPSDIPENEVNKNSESLRKLVENQYHVIGIKDNKGRHDRKEILFEVHGAPNSPATELNGTDKMRAAVGLGHKPDDVQADANVSRVREYKKKESVVKAILWDGSDEAYKEIGKFAGVPVTNQGKWLWVKVDPEYGPSLYPGHYLIRDENEQLHAVESIYFLSQFELK